MTWTVYREIKVFAESMERELEKRDKVILRLEKENAELREEIERLERPVHDGKCPV